MKQIDEYHQKLISRLEQAASEFRAACMRAAFPEKPIEPGGWSVHQVAVHTRDVDRMVYGARARRTLVEDNPLFPNFDGDAYMTQHYDPNEPLPRLLDELVASVRELAGRLRESSPEGWSHQSRHATQGAGLTVQTWVERGLEHIEEHLLTVKKAIQD
jgi:hypothetical protein